MILKKITKLVKSYSELITLKDSIGLFKIKNKYRSKILNPIMETFTFIGSGGAVWGLPILIDFLNKKTRLDSILAFTSVSIDVMSNNLFTKLFFHRPRPCHRYPEEYFRGSLPFGYSFPSGHALTSFSAATVFTLSNWKNIFWALPLASLISFSRAYLFVHYPSDIYSGILGGIISGSLVYFYGHKIYNERKFPILNAIVALDL